MAYLGNDLQVAYQSYQIIDDISSSFNGVLTTFPLQVGGVTPVPFPINPQQCLISVNGVIQEPDPSGTSGFNLVGNNIEFSSAPTGGHAFFGIILAGADYVNVGVNYPSGSESAPSITFDADLDTGIYNPAANELGFSTNSVQRLKIESDGDINIDSGGVFYDATNNRLAIGTTTVDAKLHVSESNTNAASTTSTDVNRILLDDISGSTSLGAGYSIDFEGVYGGLGRLAISKATSATSGSSRDNGKFSLFLNQNLSEDSYSAFEEAITIDSAGTDQGLVYRFRGSEQFRIDSSGRLLVGTSTSLLGSTLQVSGTGGGTVEVSRFAANNAGPFINIFKSRGASVGTNTTVIEDDLLGAVQFQGAEGTGYQPAANIRAFVDGSTISSASMPGRLVFSVTADGASSPTERMRISQNGYTSIYGNNDALDVRVGASAGTSNAFLVGRYSASGVLSGGTVGIYIWSNGNIQNTNNSYTAISDIKLKENVLDAASQWDDLKAIQVRNYNFKEETGHETHTQIGVIAQEVELVSPGLVNETADLDDEGNDLGTVTKSVNYSVLYMKAVKALQEAMERIETLEAKVAALETP